MEKKNSPINEIENLLFSSKEISGVGTVGTIRLLRGKLTKAVNLFGRIFSYSSSRSYGAFFLSFGLLTLFLNLGEYYFTNVPVEVLSSLIIGAVFSCVAIPFLLIDKPICIAVQDFVPTDYLFFEFFSIKRMHREYDGKTIPFIVAFSMGIIPAFVEFFVSPEIVILSMAVLIFIPIALTSPEFPMIFTLLVLPYMSIIPGFKIVLACLSILSFISFIYKVVVGKRVFNFDIYTLLLVFIMLFIIAGGILMDGGTSLFNSFYLVSIVLGYFPAANLIVNRRLADCAIKSVIVSSIPASILAILEYISECFNTGINISLNKSSGISATFSSPAALGAFLTVATVLALAFFFEKRNKAKKISYLIIFAVNMFSLVLTMQPSAWLTVILSIFAYFIINSKKVPVDAVFPLFLSAHLLFLLPASLVDPVFEFFGFEQSYSAMIDGLERSIDVLIQNIWLGIGISGEALGNSDISAAENTNLVLGIGLELGIFVLCLFFITMIVRLRHLNKYRRYYVGSNVELSVKMTALATLALLYFGVGEYIFSDTLILYLFLSVFGICTSAMRTAKRENDDRLGYYSDARTFESSVIDVSLY